MEPYAVGTIVKIKRLSGNYRIAAALKMLADQPIYIVMDTDTETQVYELFYHRELTLLSTKGKKLEEYF